jgi:hypothetical protein
MLGDVSVYAVSEQHAYRPSPRSRVTAFFFTDRNGQTLAATLGLFTVARWWLRGRFRN